MDQQENPGRENPLRAEKRKKLHALKELGLNPFPHNFKPSHKAAEILKTFNALEPGIIVFRIAILRR